MNTKLRKSLGLCMAGLISSSVFLIGCQKTGGDQFLGTWSTNKPNEGALTIKKKGSMYFIYVSDTELLPYCPSGASYEQGKLNCGNGLSFGYDSDKDTIIYGLGVASYTLNRIK